MYTTNNDPKIIVGYFLEAIQDYGGWPRLVKGDCGTENVRVKIIQEELMGNGRKGHCTTYIQGASTSKQWIESFWVHLRKQCIEHWINIFCDLEEENGNFLGDYSAF